ncbi:MAG: Eco57I restriction-modification methylase domain-containing protein, partial [Bacteroidota bacterium]
MTTPNTAPNLFNADGYYAELEEAVVAMATASIDDRGAIFTKSCVVNFILDLVGYTIDQPLFQRSLLEPAAGTGAFFLPALDRLLEAWNRTDDQNARTLLTCLRAVELHTDSYLTLKAEVRSRLLNAGIQEAQADQLCDAWLIQGDFLLTKGLNSFDYVVGNPPYVRQEKISPILLSTYRAKYKTLYDRADLYIPFFERSLKLLNPDGELGFICTDRWTKNKYGAPLRRMIAKSYHLKSYVDLVGVQAFDTDVATYPAITVIKKSKGSSTRFLAQPALAPPTLSKLATELNAPVIPTNSEVIDVARVVNGPQPWILDKAPLINIVRQLEQQFPTLEAAGCKVGIGVATGADKIFITDQAQLDIEDSRKLPLVTTKDISDTGVRWKGCVVLNPYEANGSLANLEAYPRFKAYVLQHQEKLAARHVAKKSPGKWYKTIDRIYPELAARPKLLIPDIKGHASIVYENEGLYPHHNLYYIVSDTWDLRALQTVLLSGIAELFVSTYS